MKKTKLSDIAEVRNIVKSSKSVLEVARKLGYAKSGGVHKQLKMFFRKNKIVTSHFKGQSWQKGETKKTSEAVARQARLLEIPWEQVFCKDSSYQGSGQSLIKKLRAAEKIEYKCSICSLKDWQKQSIVLQLDHINGDNTDHREKNLRLLCPNCHSQTPTWGGRRFKKQKNVDTEGSWRIKDKPEQRKVKRPTKEKLIALLGTHSYSALGRKFGVSDNAVRKWAKRYKIIQ